MLGLGEFSVSSVQSHVVKECEALLGSASQLNTRRGVELPVVEYPAAPCMVWRYCLLRSPSRGGWCSQGVNPSGCVHLHPGR